MRYAPGLTAQSPQCPTCQMFSWKLDTDRHAELTVEPDRHLYDLGSMRSLCDHVKEIVIPAVTGDPDCDICGGVGVVFGAVCGCGEVEPEPYNYYKSGEVIDCLRWQYGYFGVGVAGAYADPRERWYLSAESAVITNWYIQKAMGRLDDDEQPLKQQTWMIGGLTYPGGLTAAMIKAAIDEADAADIDPAIFGRPAQVRQQLQQAMDDMPVAPTYDRYRYHNSLRTLAGAYPGISKDSDAATVAAWCNMIELPCAIVGTWVWVKFSQTPLPSTMKLLPAAGFFYNVKRGIWQHKCGSGGHARSRLGTAALIQQFSTTKQTASDDE